MLVMVVFFIAFRWMHLSRPLIMLFLLVLILLLMPTLYFLPFFFFQAEDGIRVTSVTGVQTCALPISPRSTRCAATPSPPKAEPRPPWGPATRSKRSEERRVGKECRSRGSPYLDEKKNLNAP